MHFDDQMIRAIRNKFAPDMMTALKDASLVELQYPKRSINVPLFAGADIVYDKGLGSFTIEGKVKYTNKDEFVMARQVFSTRELMDSRESSEIINYLFDRLKYDFTEALVEGKLNKILGS